MFDFIYYAVSFILWCWHKVFALVLGDENFIGWALSIVFLVFTLRLVLLKPAIAQIRSMRKMQKFAPEMKKIQKKYANDRQRQAAEMQKLQREHGVNPLGGCLPMVLQIPVFLGLNHVLREFRPSTSEVYFFKQADVTSYLHAKLFAAHLGDQVFGGTLGNGFHWGVAPVAVPLMIVASVATHFTARLSSQRQEAMGTPMTGQAAMMSKLTMWLFPLGVLVFGFGFPVGLLMYWLSNNLWTLGQQHFVFQRIDREEEKQKEAAIQQRQALGPKPGQKPNPDRRKVIAKPADDAADTESAIEDAKPVEDAKPATRSTAPRPGQKPAQKRPAPKPGTAQVKTGAAAKTGTTPKANPKTGAAQKPAATPRSGTKAAGTAGTSANGKADSSEIPGLIADRSRRKKQDPKRG